MRSRWTDLNVLVRYVRSAVGCVMVVYEYRHENTPIFLFEL